MAIESASVLSRSLKEEADLRSALMRYESERHARTAWVTKISRTIGKGGQISNPVLCLLRNYLVKVTPAGAMQTNIQRAARFNVLTAPENGSELNQINNKRKPSWYRSTN